LRARVDGAKAKYAELAANYAQTVLIALREVEDALAQERLLQLRLNALQLRFTEASAAETLARQRYLRGVERLITVLEAERRRRIAENELNNVKGRLWAGRVDLFLALGGDWITNS
jgi:outer membrane protein TolC